MKMKGAKQVHYDSGPNMTPLVDVVMVILIFLMLAGSFGGSTQFLMSKQGLHKKGRSTTPPDPNIVLDTPIEVHVEDLTSAGVSVGFRAQGTGIPTTNSGEALRKSLEAKRQQFISGGNKPDKLEVVLYPGTGVKYKYLIEVYQAALLAKYTKVAFATSH
jgi:biopolymer transport protein ExbD